MKLKALFTAMSMAILVTPAIKADLPTPFKTKMDVKKTQQVQVNAVKIEDFSGKVIIKSTNTGKTVDVHLAGSDELLKQVVVTSDHQSHKGTLYIALEKDAPTIQDINKLVLTLNMPADLPLDLTLVGGKADVGMREIKDTTLNLKGYGEIDVDSLKGLKSRIDGSGEITVNTIDGDAEIQIRGDGTYLIQKGTISDLKATIQGTGEMNVQALVQDAHLKSEGAGTIRLETVTGKLSQSMSGAGSISIAKVTGSVKNSVSGSGQFEMVCGETPFKTSGGKK